MSIDRIEFVPRRHQPRSPAHVLLSGIPQGTISQRVLQSLSSRVLNEEFRIGEGTLERLVLDYFRDVGYQCDPLRSYFDLHLVESVLVVTEDEGSAHIREQTIESLLDEEYEFFNDAAQRKREDVWAGPSLHERLAFLARHVAMLFNVGAGVSIEQLSLVIPNVAWLEPIEREVEVEGKKFVDGRPLAGLHHDIVLERVSAKLQIAIARRMIRV